MELTEWEWSQLRKNWTSIEFDLQNQVQPDWTSWKLHNGKTIRAVVDGGKITIKQVWYLGERIA